MTTEIEVDMTAASTKEFLKIVNDDFVEELRIDGQSIDKSVAHISDDRVRPAEMRNGHGRLVQQANREVTVDIVIETDKVAEFWKSMAEVLEDE